MNSIPFLCKAEHHGGRRAEWGLAHLGKDEKKGKRENSLRNENHQECDVSHFPLLLSLHCLPEPKNDIKSIMSTSVN